MRGPTPRERILLTIDHTWSDTDPENDALTREHEALVRLGWMAQSIENGDVVWVNTSRGNVAVELDNLVRSLEGKWEP